MTIDKEKILRIAQRYFLKGQSKKAIKELLKLVEASPKDIRLRIKLGDLYLKDGENESAIKEYLKVAELYEKEDLNLKAVSIYKKVLSISPKHIEALRKMAALYLKEGLEGSARNCYQTILKVRPDDSETLSALEEIDHLHQPGNVSPKTFSSNFLTSAPRTPSEPRVGDGRPPTLASGELSSPPGETEEPPSSYKDAETHYHLGIAYKEMDLFDYAITEFEMASEDPSIRFDCYIMLGACYVERNDYNKAIESYVNASKIEGPSNEKMAHLYFNLGLAYEANSKVPDALEAFKLALDLDQSLSDAREKIEKLQRVPG